MGLIKKILEERELKKEERLILREMAQERLDKKRELEKKQKVFDTMLDMRLPCENIIRLESDNPDWYRFNYYLMDAMPLTILLLIQEGVQLIPCKFKALTSMNAGQIYKGVFNPSQQDNIKMYLNPLDRSKLVVSIHGYRNDKIEQHFGEKNELEKIYGKTISLRQLLNLWKEDNQRKDINIDDDYEMVKRLYDSKDILKEDCKEISK